LTEGWRMSWEEAGVGTAEGMVSS